MSNPSILLDACVTINLAAAARLDEIAHRVSCTFLVTRQAANEVGHLRDTRDGELVLIPVNLNDHVQAGVFEITDLTACEIPLYVELARLVDDGEASSIAAAITRGLPLATDDRKARRVCVERGLTEPVSTTSLVRRYCEASGLEHPGVSVLLRSISSRASFLPPRSDPNLKWWNDYLGGGPAR